MCVRGVEGVVPIFGFVELIKPLSCLAVAKIDSDVGVDVGVSQNRGTPKWMVYNGNPY